ncbi:hypothetical protein [Nocardia puris]|uniref:Uncharacterized protein n=1 Tax=Nocardia puris TaxID=208602 RepID=A0A366DAH3_9NOCA|nr:hypothetical protein [Nocardia puris]RBO87016.1 hypothetical protein DFR74_112193 [Nocardia puris]
MNRLRQLLADEPLLTRVGPAVALLVAYLLARGVIDSSTADLVVGIVGVLVGGGVMASARSKVTPWRPYDKGGILGTDPTLPWVPPRDNTEGGDRS